MLPAVKHNAAWAQVGVRFLQAIEAIGNTIATLIPLGNEGTTKRTKVRAIIVRELSIA